MRNINKITLLGVLLFMNASIGTRITGSDLGKIQFGLRATYEMIAEQYYDKGLSGYDDQGKLGRNLVEFESLVISNINEDKQMLSQVGSLLDLVKRMFDDVNELKLKGIKKCNGHKEQKSGGFYNHSDAEKWGEAKKEEAKYNKNIERHNVVMHSQAMNSSTCYDPIYTYMHCDDYVGCNDYYMYLISAENFANYINECQLILLEKFKNLNTKIEFQNMQSKLAENEIRMRKLEVECEQEKSELIQRQENEIARLKEIIRRQNAKIVVIQKDDKKMMEPINQMQVRVNKIIDEMGCVIKFCRNRLENTATSSSSSNENDDDMQAEYVDMEEMTFTQFIERERAREAYKASASSSAAAAASTSSPSRSEEKTSKQSS